MKRQVNYDRVIIFTKHTDLMPYFEAKRNSCLNPELWDKVKHKYQEKRDVTLLLQLRYEREGVICNIKCPINPLPVKGEFKAVHLGALISFLVNNGWIMKGSYGASMFM